MKRIAMVLCALIIFVVSAGNLTAYAAPIDPQKPSSLTIQYKYAEQVYPELPCRIYRVAEVFPDGTYALTGPFADYPVNIYGIGSQAEWKNIASTLGAYIAADQLQPDGSTVTDETGTAAFQDILPGMYLTLSTSAGTDTGTVVFETFLTVVPYPSDQGTHNYDVTVYPKALSYTPSPDEIEYKVIKQWKDAGYTANRPQSITVDIIKDGLVHSTQILSADNDWCYRWTAPDDGSQWQAVERAVPGVYTVTVVKDGGTIVITNVYEQEPEPPQTGDILVLWPFLLLLSLCGGGVLILAVWRMRYSK